MTHDRGIRFRVPVAAAIMLILAAARPAAAGDPLTPEQRAWLERHGPLRYAPDPVFPPFEYVDAVGAVTGLTPALLETIATRLGTRIEPIRYPSWTDALQAAERGEVDILGTLTRTPERERFLSFSKPYLWVPFALFVGPSQPALTRLHDCRGLAVGVSAGSGAEAWLGQTAPEIQARPQPDSRTAFALLAEGRLDVVVETLPVGLYLIRHRSLAGVRVADSDLARVPQHLATPRREPMLAAIVATGLKLVPAAERTRVFTRWTGLDLSQPPPLLSPLAARLLTGLALVLLAVGSWSWSLRRAVGRRTRELAESEERYRTVADFTHDLEYWRAPDGRLLYISPSCERVTGYSREEFMSDPGLLVGIIHPDDRGPIERHSAPAVGVHPSEAIEFRIIRKDGAIRWIGHVCRDVFGRDGRLLGVRGSNRDITEVKAAQQAVARQELYFRSLTENTLDIISILAADGTVLYESPSVERLLGYRPEELIGTSAMRHVHPHDLQEVSDRFAACVATPGVTPRFEFRFRHREGSWRVLEAIANNLLDDENVGGIIVNLRDVTERSETEQALERSAGRLELIHAIDSALLAGTSPGAIAAIALAGLRQMTGCERAAVIVVEGAEASYLAVDQSRALGVGPGHRFAIDPRLLDPRGDGTLNGVRSVTSLADRVPAVHELVSPDVRSLVVLPLVFDGRTFGLLSLASTVEGAFDATAEEVAREVADELAIALQQDALRARIAVQQQQLADVVARLPLGLVVLAGDRIALANRLGREHLAALSAGSNGRVLGLGGVDLEELLSSPEGTFSLTLPSGRGYDVTAHDLGETEPPRRVLLIRDVTEERAAAVRIEQQGRLALVGQLAGGIAHDLNNMLVTILTYPEMLLRRADLDPQVRAALKTVVEQAERSARLVRQVLDFSRQSVSERRPVALVPFLGDLTRLLERTLPENVAVSLSCAVPGEIEVQADATQLQQVLMNLALNARDAMPAGGSLAIIARAVESEAVNGGPARWVEVEVRDTGSGIDPEHLPRVFEPFFTTKPAGEGTGLGLAQVYGIVKQHGGSVSINSTIGAGTSVRVLLPEHEGDASRAPQPVAELEHGRGELVLLVEDEPQVRAALREALTVLGYRVTEACNGRQALELFASLESVDLVLTDVTMPEMGGVELLRTLSERGASVPVVALTGYSSVSHVEELREAGVVEVAQKPLSLEQLGGLVRRALGDEAAVRR